MASGPKREDSREVRTGKSQSRGRARRGRHSVIQHLVIQHLGHIDGRISFVICSKRDAAFSILTSRLPEDARMDDSRMDAKTMKTSKTLLLAAAFGALATAAFAQAAAPAPWVLSPDMGYGYDKDGKTFSYKMGTNNAGMLLKGAKKVPKGTLFFIGQNGQLYMRTGPFLEGDGKFMFGPN